MPATTSSADAIASAATAGPCAPGVVRGRSRPERAHAAAATVVAIEHATARPSTRSSSAGTAPSRRPPRTRRAPKYKPGREPCRERVPAGESPTDRLETWRHRGERNGVHPGRQPPDSAGRSQPRCAGCGGRRRADSLRWCPSACPSMPTRTQANGRDYEPRWAARARVRARGGGGRVRRGRPGCRGPGRVPLLRRVPARLRRVDRPPRAGPSDPRRAGRDHARARTSSPRSRSCSSSA